MIIQKLFVLTKHILKNQGIFSQDGIENTIFWIITSAIHLGITIKYRYNTVVVYRMTGILIIILLLLWYSGIKRKKNFF